MGSRDDERTELDDVVVLERSRFDELAARANRASSVLADRERETIERQRAEESARASCATLLLMASDRVALSTQPGDRRGVCFRIEAAARARMEAASALRAADAARISAQAHLDQVRGELAQVEGRIRALENAIEACRRERRLRRTDDVEHEEIEEATRQFQQESAS